MTNDTVNTPAREDYLKAIYRAGGGEMPVAPSEIARILEVKNPSVTAMLKRLAEDGLLDYLPGESAKLNEKGLESVMSVLRRHRLLERFLVEVLHLDWSEVHEEAEVLEHHLSDRIVGAIDRLLGYPAEDPHGHLIPDAKGLMRARTLTPLGELGVGDRGTVREVNARDAARLRRWKQLGFVPGARVVMQARQELEDVMHIGLGEKTVVTGREGVEGVLVERS